MLLSSHLALVRQVLQEPADSQRHSSATQTAGTGNQRDDVPVSLSSQGKQSNTGTGTGTGNTDSYQKAKPHISTVSRTGSQKLLEAMIEAMSGEREFDNAGSIINTYI